MVWRAVLGSFAGCEKVGDDIVMLEGGFVTGCGSVTCNELVVVIRLSSYWVGRLCV